MQFSKVKPHIIIIILFALISFAYFSPLIEGKSIDGHDIKTWIGMSKEISDFRDSSGTEALWTNSMFSGMPAYQISVKYSSNLVRYIDKVITLGFPRPANILFLYLLGFYLLLLSLKVDYRIAAVGAIAYAFSSYFFIIIQAGHMTKAHAIAYLPMVVASVIYTYRGKLLLGGVLTALTVALELYSNHLQITYYLIFILIFIGLYQLFHDYNTKNLPSFFKRSAVLILAALLATGTCFTRLKTTMDYGKDSTRGKSELTNNIENKTKGLDKDYATQWSYGIAETMTLLIPNFHGGASQGELSTDSETYNALKRSPNAKKIIKNLPLYWGDQPIVSGPTYAGAIVIFLFLLSLFLLKGRFKYWILTLTILSIFLAWGKNFMPLTELFLDFFPGYNKFRAVSMILIVAEFTLPLLAFLAFNNFIFSDANKLSKIKSLKNAFFVTGGITLLFSLAPNMFFDFVGVNDSVLASNGWPVEALQLDRASMLSSDAWRSFFFVSLAFLSLFLFIKNKVSSNNIILVFAVLLLLDMWTINKRYLNDSHFIRSSKIKTPYKATQADNYILSDNDPNFRVFNQSVSTFNDASTSYFHKSIGGYHGAKLKRYQELIDSHISKGNMQVLNMLNTKYFILQTGKVNINPNVLGNAWFIKDVKIVENADDEILALNDFDASSIAVIDKRFQSFLIEFSEDSSSNIKLDEYQPNYLRYSSVSTKNQIAVFSEVYYDKGWNSYIDGELVSHFRANYILRAMNVPKGNHTIEFRFEPEIFKIGERISLASSILLIISLIFVSVRELKLK
ncbi:MAG: YfhO family protein [Flavobacteriales bacterium]